MPRSGVVGALLLVLLATGCGSRRTVTTTVTVERKAPAASSAGDRLFYGRITSVVRSGEGYEVRFDPAWFLSGVTANAAEAADHGSPCRPRACPPVSNDNYVVDEGHRTLVYLLDRRTRGTVLVKGGANGGSFPSTTITAAQLSKLVAGASSLTLFEPLSSGVWIVVHGDTITSFAQQYRP